MNDYERIAQVIEYLDKHSTEQPSLETLARCIGISPFHFHRLFVTWAGVTPKDFLQCLTLAHAKELLRQGENVLDAALCSGLSGPGRLHDLCVNLEAASPGEIKSGGEGWEIRFGFANTPFGEWLTAESPRGICHVSFVENRVSATAEKVLHNDWPRAHLIPDDSVAERLASVVFNRSVDHSPRPVLRAFVRGSAFQVRVWRALLQFPQGTLVSYGRLAGSVGNSASARAVGTAVGMNPLAYLIPCHRVIRKTGLIGDYRWGSIRKRAILAREQNHLI